MYYRCWWCCRCCRKFISQSMKLFCPSAHPKMLEIHPPVAYWTGRAVTNSRKNHSVQSLKLKKKKKNCRPKRPGRKSSKNRRRRKRKIIQHTIGCWMLALFFIRCWAAGELSSYNGTTTAHCEQEIEPGWGEKWLEYHEIRFDSVGIRPGCVIAERICIRVWRTGNRVFTVSRFETELLSQEIRMGRSSLLMPPNVYRIIYFKYFCVLSFFLFFFSLAGDVHRLAARCQLIDCWVGSG